jgi:hypothetical protein
MSFCVNIQRPSGEMAQNQIGFEKLEEVKKGKLLFTEKGIKMIR